ncbi:hypothetical protein ABER99_20000 [Paenibacillus glucanolyticus]|nr:hypothetical protein [Paenibacillus glucanolyticus]OMF64124.1 hypothetical protein BK142_32185 [Paenibacillus glucanolyticus]
MMNSISKVFTLILAIILLYVFPLDNSAQHQDDISFMTAYKSVTTFVDSVRDKGYITPTMYNDFFESLQSTGNTYEINLEHRHKTYDPIYDNMTDPHNPQFVGGYALNYDEFFSHQILSVLFPDNTKKIDDPSRLYKLSKGDFFSVTVKNTNRTPSQVLRDFITNGNNTDAKIYIPYGGMIYNEDYE